MESHPCTLTLHNTLEVLVKLYDHDFIVKFLSQMIPCHMEGIRMSNMVLSTIQNENVNHEAQMLIQSQTPELQQMI